MHGPLIHLEMRSTEDDGHQSGTVQLIYEAALDFNRWPAVLEQLADDLGASVACLVRHDIATSEGTMVMVRTDPRFARLYSEHYARLNVFAQRAGNRPPQTVITDRMVLPKEELFSTEFYDGFMLPQHVHTLMNLYLLSEGTSSTRIALARSPRAGEWDQEHTRRLSSLAPHLHHAARVNRQFEAVHLSAETAFSALDRLTLGIVIVDDQSHVFFANRAAQEMVAAADGLAIDSAGLSVAHRAQSAVLRRLIAEAATEVGIPGSGSGLSAARPSLRRPYSLLVTPLRRSQGWCFPKQSGAVVLIRDPERAPSLSACYLRRRYGLTPAEAAVTMEIMKGGGLGEAAQALSVSLTTARTHLQHVFEKTGTHRQAELVRLIGDMQAELTLGELPL